MNPVINQLKRLGFDCAKWEWPTLQHGTLLHITILDNSEAHGASLCVRADSTLEQALAQIESKRNEFRQAAINK